MDGEPQYRVSKGSATDGHWNEGAPGCYPLNKDHSHLVKFKAYDEEYAAVLQVLKKMVATALGQTP
jgi:hypothetical protein